MKGEIVIKPDATYFISVLFVFIFIVVAAYYVTKLIAKNGSVLIKGKNMKVVEKISLGLDKSIYLIHIGKHYYILAASKQNIDVIDKINEEDMKVVSKNKQYEKMDEDFDTLLDKYLYEDNTFSQDQPKNFDAFTNTMMNKLKEMKRRTQGVKQHTDRDEMK
ncbi:flagellar biosynthetic protein FliO [Crassaminicella profunda]|uniref:flagellar biosynthetic protein FliO n=1 Tax=Crassaminicella profunda TaxID=1286698 RepID=UPI001CA60023|nr:flagellar biosynthetic protein FliO [Crassaminicella profunda]QZY56763.1 flagellar biosynthetic protein FliO [Crassaminicella profunda]